PYTTLFRSGAIAFRIGGAAGNEGGENGGGGEGVARLCGDHVLPGFTGAWRPYYLGYNFAASFSSWGVGRIARCRSPSYGRQGQRVPSQDVARGTGSYSALFVTSANQCGRPVARPWADDLQGHPIRSSRRVRGRKIGRAHV